MDETFLNQSRESMDAAVKLTMRTDAELSLLEWQCKQFILDLRDDHEHDFEEIYVAFVRMYQEIKDANTRA